MLIQLEEWLANTWCSATHPKAFRALQASILRREAAIDSIAPREHLQDMQK